MSAAVEAAVIPVVGWAAMVALAPGRRAAAEWAATAVLAGAGTTGVALTWLSLAGRRPSTAVLLAVGAVALAIGFAGAGAGRRSAPQWRSPRPATPLRGWRLTAAVALGLVLIACLATLVVGAAGWPVLEWDAVAIWQFKAKMLAHAPLPALRDTLADRTLSFSHVRYPPLWPMLCAAAASPDARGGRLIEVALAAAAGLLIYAGARRSLGRAGAMLVVALAAACPTTLRWAGQGLADVPLAALSAGAAYYAAAWARDGDGADLRLASLFGACLALTKNEGLAIALIGAAAMGFSVEKRRWRRGAAAALVAAAAAAVALLPWWYYGRGLPATDEDYASRLTAAELLRHAPRLASVLPAMAREAVDPSHWGLLWLALAAAAALAPAALRRRDARALWAVLLLQWAAYAAVYLVTPWSVERLVGDSFDRLLLHGLPAAALLLAIHWGCGTTRAADGGDGRPVGSVPAPGDAGVTDA